MIKVETIRNWLEYISTPTGISYSGDRTLSKSEVKEILDYIEQLQNNWNELKKWLGEIIEDIDKIEYPDSYDKGEKATLKNILRHMQELEQGKDVKDKR